MKNDRKYPENNVLNSQELMAIELHLKLDKRHGYTDKSTWPEWLAEKFERAINNPYKNFIGIDTGNDNHTIINEIEIGDGKIVSIKEVDDTNFLF